jgi:hypothetical protein
VPAKPAADPIGAVDFQDLIVIAETFLPYLEARDWTAIGKETP